MGATIDASVAIVGYLALFAGVGLAFIFVNLLVGRFLRPSNPNTEKLEIYECGEPAIGSSFVQSDLRFYVVALVFIIFDVEVAFLFPWATVFGKVAHLLRNPAPMVEVVNGTTQLTPAAAGLYREMGDSAIVPALAGDAETVDRVIREGQFSDAGVLELAGLQQMLWIAAAAIGLFFVVLLVGFAYEWRTGALDWVRAITKSSTPSSASARTREMAAGKRESVLSA